MAGKHILKITEDGSHTLFVPELNEHYHSTHGAIQESNHVYIQAGLAHCKKQHISILEIGFGTGLNALLTALYAEKHKLIVHYTSYELYPVDKEIVSSLNYGKQVDEKLFSAIHTAEWNNTDVISPFFTLLKIKEDVQTAIFSNTFDVVYFDAFAPEIQPVMWDAQIFEKIYNSLHKGGILTTYCAKGVVQRTLRSTGFKIEKLPGPPGKREIIRAVREF